MHALNRFLKAQESSYTSALNEIKSGKKLSHWMWFIFPQIAGLGRSEIARHYAIADAKEAISYLAHPVLGQRLVEISRELLNLTTSNATEVFGTPDDLKLRSSMTLFASLPAADPVFKQVLNKFYEGKPDEKTLALLQ